MSGRSLLILKSIALTCFSVIVLFFFRYYSMLRPVACGAFYKEWLTGGIVLALCYLNYLILYPHLYEKRQPLVYVLVIVFSAAVATFLEVMLVYPHVNAFLGMINDISSKEYYSIMVVSLFFRDLCFAFFFFLIRLLESAYSEKRDVNLLLQNSNELLLARTVDKENALLTVRLENIVYCQQDENYAYMYLVDGTKVCRNCSLKSLYELLTPSRAVRISRKILVLYPHVVSYDNNSVYVSFSNNDVSVGLEITDTFRQYALTLLRDHCEFVEKRKIETVPEITTVNTFNMSSGVLQAEYDNAQAVDFSKNEYTSATRSVLAFITSHPDCKGSDIKEYFQHSLSTVNRILAQLKQDGLIEYVGSKKTGGYKVRQQPNQAVPQSEIRP